MVFLIWKGNGFHVVMEERNGGNNFIIFLYCKLKHNSYGKNLATKLILTLVYYNLSQYLFIGSELWQIYQ